MDESIGAKGGKNDRRRTFILTRNQKKKLEEIEKVQKKSRKQKSIKRIDLETFIKIIPILLVANTLEVITPSKKKEKNVQTDQKHEKEEKQLLENKNKDLLVEIETLKLEKEEEKKFQKESYDAQESKPSFDSIKLPIDASKKDEVQEQQDEILLLEDIEDTFSQSKSSNLSFEEKHDDTVFDTKEQDSQKQSSVLQRDYSSFNLDIGHEHKAINIQANEGLKKEKQSYTLKRRTPPLLNASAIFTGSFLFHSHQEKKERKEHFLSDHLSRLTNIKLIEAYENELRSIRYDLKKLIYEYNTLVDEEDATYTSENMKELIHKLNSVILKIEELKRKLDLDNISRYDDDYLRNIVNEYMDILGKGIVIDELKDSELYILLSDKITELESKKDKFEEHVLDKEEDISYDEKEIDLMKKGFENLQVFNEDFQKFQIEQEKLLQNLQEKLANSERVEERIETTVTVLNNQSKRLLQLLAAGMMLPNTSGARQVTVATLAYMYFFRRALRPKLQKQYKRYRKITVEDFSHEILGRLNELNMMADTLHKCSLSLDEMIYNFKTEYREYINHVPECQELLNNLNQMQSNLKEKEFDLEQIRKEQQKNLEINDDKVKVLHKEELVTDENNTI
ncbi:MAG: hypothetical protein HFJ38_06170 [Bacilli bacterium]|nr:hypothetical protein [Bacilli bacterium]